MMDKKDKILLKEIIMKIRLRDKNLKIKKIAGSDLYHMREGIFKIIFHYDALGNTIIDSIRMKEKTAP